MTKTSQSSKLSEAAGKLKSESQKPQAAAESASSSQVAQTQSQTPALLSPQTQPTQETQTTPSARFKYQRKAKTPTSGFVISYAEPPSPNSDETPTEESSNSSASAREAQQAAATVAAAAAAAAAAVESTASLTASERGADTQSGDEKLQRQQSTPKSHKRAKSHKHKKSKKKMKHEMEAGSGGGDGDGEGEEQADEVASSSRMNGVVIATSCVENGDGSDMAASAGGEHEAGAKPPLTTTIKFNVSAQSKPNVKKTKNASGGKKHKRRR
ncbi:PREDICTED: uncharacterized protein LOC108354425 [Rhagoletis zephyria]|uniref:uncharacterized protein LOC108354425 n=1 Tax=Rhagoletis zephyria TaxID=28612 RepID=UPI0008116E18|nr:PREDICTED: uncharacterized protein LOC108354425 [Rhagoletis zephyria]